MPRAAVPVAACGHDHGAPDDGSKDRTRERDRSRNDHHLALLGRAHRVTAHPGTSAGGPTPSRNVVGGTPTTRVNVEVNDPTLAQPVSNAIAVTGCSVSCSSRIARSSRRRCR